MRKRIRLTSVALTVLFSLMGLQTQVLAKEADLIQVPPVKAYTLMEANTGEILYTLNGDARLPIASVTKLMVLLLLAEELQENRLRMEDVVTASVAASRTEGSVIWLEQGETMTVQDLIKAVVISSANDACIALAEHVAGTEQAFVQRMNEKAKALGLVNTHFTGCVGFDAPNHFASANDIAVITAELMQYDCFSEFFHTRLSSVRTGTERETQLLNTNKLAAKYEGLLGGKTGTTDDAGFCLSVCAERGNMRLIAVTLGAKNEDDRVTLSKYLLDRGFADFELYQPELDEALLHPVDVEKGVVKTVETRTIGSGLCVIPKGRGEAVEFEINLPECIEAPFEAGTALGSFTVLLDGQPIYEDRIVTKDAVEELTLVKCVEILLKHYFVAPVY